MFKKILIALDTTKPNTCQRLCDAVIDLLGKSKAEIKLVSVVPDFGMSIVASYFPSGAQDKLKAEVEQNLATYAAQIKGQSVSTAMPTGKRAQGILQEANEWESDLIILGARKKQSQGENRLLGSCGQSVTNRSACSVLVVK